VFQEEIQEIANALAQLPTACRETMILRRIEGLSQKETAQRLKISEKTVEKHMARGVWMLIDIFGHGGKSKVRTSSLNEEVCSNDEIIKPGD